MSRMSYISYYSTLFALVQSVCFLFVCFLLQHLILHFLAFMYAHPKLQSSKMSQRGFREDIFWFIIASFERRE